MALTVAWIWLIGMLGSKIYTFGPKSGWPGAVTGVGGVAAGAPAARAARVGAAWERNIPPTAQRSTTSERMRRRTWRGGALISTTFMVTPSSSIRGVGRAACM